MSVAGYFEIHPEDARAVAWDVGRAVKHWRQIATARGLSTAAQDRMASAFEHNDLAAVR